MSYKKSNLVLCILWLLLSSSCASGGRVAVKFVISDPSTRSLLAPNPNDDIPWDESKGYVCVSPQDAQILFEGMKR